MDEVKLDEEVGNELAAGSESSESSRSKNRPGRPTAKSDKSKDKAEKEVRWLAFAESN